MKQVSQQATSIEADRKELLRTKLLETFGYSEFRIHQLPIMQCLLAGKDVIAILPTGVGKSLCYQLPALIQSGTAIVVSPLLALMKNQIDQLQSAKVSAHFLSSTLSRHEIKVIKENTVAGRVQLLYISPESLIKAENLSFFKSFKISFCAIDEAHCISEWGHDFRPEYRRIREFLAQVPRVPIIALTATATPKVQLDIQKNLPLNEPQIFKTSLNRKNIFYEIVPKQGAYSQLLTFLRNRKDENGIVYCLTRKKVEEITEMLVRNDIAAVPYHAGLDSKTRVKNQEAFLNQKVNIIIATVAFGMGIDKPDIAFVVHHSAPKSLENYYQETGRTGRNGMHAHCLMLFSYRDIDAVAKFSKSKSLMQRENSTALLEEMCAYAETPVCRRKQLLAYLGENFEESPCGMCDSCTSPTEQFEATKHLKLILEALVQTGNKHSYSYMTDVLMGKKTRAICDAGHDQIAAFSAGTHEKAVMWRVLLRQACHQGFIKAIANKHDGATHLELAQAGTSFLKKSYTVHFRKPYTYKNAINAEVEEGSSKDGLERRQGTVDPELLAQLYDLQQKLAKNHQVPAYIIFQPHSLDEMATYYPTTSDELLQIHGVGKGKVERYAQPFLKLIQNYVHQYDIQPITSVLVKLSDHRSRLKIDIIRHVDKKMHLKDIAKSLKIEFDTLLQEMERICYAGTKLYLKYHLDSLLEPDRQQEIYDYFLNSVSDDLGEACKEMEHYTEEEIRLVRMRFVSELAN